MKLIKTLSAATLLSVTSVTGIANAAIAFGEGGAGVDGELFVSIWDPNANLSYHRDLGITVNEFRANPGALGSVSLAGDSVFMDFLNAGAQYGNLLYNVSGINSQNSRAGSPNLGYLATTNQGLSAVEGSAVDFTALNQTIGNINSYISALNGAAGQPFDGNNAGDNNSAISENPANANPMFPTIGYHGDPTWGSNMGAGVTFDTHGMADDPLQFYFANSLNDGTVDSANRVQTLLLGAFTLNSANGELAFSPGTAVIPVPAAVWLMATGIVGLVGIGRRASTSA